MYHSIKTELTAGLNGTSNYRTFRLVQNIFLAKYWTKSGGKLTLYVVSREQILILSVLLLLFIRRASCQEGRINISA
jgi:hypothetical protein